MPQKLVPCLLLLAALAGCSVQPVPEERVPCACEQPYEALQHWLALSTETASMETSEIVAELVKLGRPREPIEHFYYGLLNQRLSTAANWRQARNAFREVRKNAELQPEQRHLAALLEAHNIEKLDNNADRKNLLRTQAELEAALSARSRENAVLEEKIRALTDVEESMSTRIEQEQ